MSCCNGILIDGSCPEGGAGTLQEAYDNSTNPEIVLKTNPGALTIRDSLTPLGTNLLEIQNNDGSTTYFSVDSTGATVDGKLTVTGLIDPTGLVLDQQASVPGGVPGASKGTIWVKNDSPNNLYFTDGSGTDYQITPAVSSVLTTKGDLLGRNATTITRIPVGADGEFLRADSASLTGLSYTTISTNVKSFKDTGGLTFTTSSAVYIRALSLNYNGSSDDGAISKAQVIAFVGAASTYSLRLQDTTNNLTIAEITGLTNTIENIVDLGTISNVPISSAILEIQTKLDAGAGPITIYYSSLELGTASVSSTTLQQVYNNSTTGSIIVDNIRGQFQIKDNSTPLVGNIFSVVDNTGATPYFEVDSTGATITGKLTVTGLIDPTGLVLTNQASVPGGTPSAGNSTLWVNSTSKNLMMTIDTGVTQNMTPVNSILTTKGDLLTYSTQATRQPVGTNNQVLIADSAQTTGLTWTSIIGSNIGLSGVGPYISNSGTTLQFKNINAASSKITVVNNGGNNTIDIDAVPNNIMPTTTKGDLIVNNGSTNVRQAVGSNNQIIIADSTQTTGIKWGDISLILPTTTKGDLIVYNGTTNVRQGVGTNTQILSANSAQSTGIQWIDNISASNINLSGVGVYNSQLGQVLQFKGINPASSKITVVSNVPNNTIDIDAVPNNIMPTTTKGDLIVHNGSTNVRQGIGNNGYVLMPDSTQTNGLSWRVLFTNIIRVDKSGNDTTGSRNGLPFLTITAALAVALPDDVVWVYPGTYTETLIIPNQVHLKGIQRDAVNIISAAVADTTLITMGTHSRIEDLYLSLTSSGHFTLKGIVFTGTTTANSNITNVGLVVDNSGASLVGTSNVYGIFSDATGTPDDSQICISNSSIVVNSIGLGTKRAISINTNAQKFNSNDSIYRITSSGGAGSYVAVETSIAGSVLTLRRCTIDGPTNYLQTAGTITLIDVDLAGLSNTFTIPLQITPTSNQLVLGTTNTTTLNAPAPGSNIILTLPTSTDTLVAKNTTDILTNKTLISNTNNITASGLFTGSGTGTVNVSAATAPSSGQALIATSGTTATWQNILSGISVIAPTNATDANGIILTGTSVQLEFATASNPGIISSTTQTFPGAKQIILLDNSSIRNTTINSKILQIDCSAISAATTGVFQPTFTTAKTLQFPDATDMIVARNTTDTLTNKTMTSTSNNITSSALFSATTTINVSSATAPSANQVLVATSGTTATWQNITSSALTIIAPTNATDANGAILSGSTLQLEYANATQPGILSSSSQTIAGSKTFSSAIQITPTTNQIILGNTNTITLNSTAPVASRTYTIPDTGANSNFVMTDGTQTINGSKSFSSAITSISANLTNTTNQLVLGTTNTTTLSAPAPAASITLTLPSTSSDTILGKDTLAVCSNKRFLDSTFFILDNTDQTKALQINVAGTTGLTSTLTLAPTAARVWTLPDATTTLVGTDNTQTLTNKTMTSTTNNITSSALFSATTTVNVSSATAPTSGQILTATSGTAATWQNPLAGVSVVAPTNATDANGIILTGTSVQLEYATATQPGILSTTSQTIAGLKSLSINDNSLIKNNTDNTKTLSISLAGQTTGIQGNFATSFTTAKTLTFPDATDTLIGKATTDILTNKTMTATSNNITSSALFSATTTVNVSSATAPTSGQILTATSSTAATWQNPLAGVSVIAPTNATDANGIILTGTSVQLEYATATQPGILSTTSQTIVGSKTFSSAVQITPTTNQFVLGTTNTTTLNAPAPAASITLTLPSTSSDTILGKDTLAICSNKRFLDSSFFILDNTDQTKAFQIDVAGTTGLTSTLTLAPTAARVWTLPDATTTLVGTDNTQTLTNKTMTSNTNNITAKSLFSNSSANTIDVSAAANPTIGQILTATSSTTATWQNPLAGVSVVAPINATDANGIILTGTSVQLEYATASNPGIISTTSQTITGLKSLSINDNSLIKNNTDNTKTLAISLAGQTTGIQGNFATSFTTAKTLTFPDATDTLVARNTTDTLTNKTMTSTSNNITSSALFSATTTVNVSSATAPTSGQILTATSGTTATWQNPLAGVSVVAPTNATDANGIILTGTSVQLEFATSTNPGIVSASAQTFPGTKQILILDNSSIVNTSTSSKRVQFDCSSISASTTGIFKPTFTTAKTLTFPDATDTLVGRDTTDTLTNKTMTSTTNNITSSALFSATTTVNVSSATAPTSGQILTATSGTAATWQNPLAGVSVVAPANATDANGIILTGTSVQLEYATATQPGILSSGTQTIAGAKTFSSNLTAPANSLTNTTNQLVLGTTNTTTLSAPAPAASITLTLPSTSSDTILGKDTLAVCSNKRFLDSSFFILDNTDQTKALQINVAGTTGVTGTLTTVFTTGKTVTFPDATDTLVGKATTDTLTNKTLNTNTTIIADNTVYQDATNSAKKAFIFCSSLTTTRNYSLPDIDNNFISVLTTTNTSVTWTGPFTVNPSSTLYLTFMQNRCVYVTIGAVSASCNVTATAASTTAIIPASMRPTTATYLLCGRATSNGATGSLEIQVAVSGFLSAQFNQGSFTGAGTGGWQTVGFCYHAL